MPMKEFTLRAVLLGLIMTAILGAANAYLGLRAGMTIAATYPAAVIGMSLLRLMKGSSWKRTWREPSDPSANPLPLAPSLRSLLSYLPDSGLRSPVTIGSRWH